MITIDEVKSVLEQIDIDGTVPAIGETLRAVCELALSQHEEIEMLKRTSAADKLAALMMLRENQTEIERLRAWQTKAVEDFAELHKELNDAYERAAEFYENAMSYGVKTTQIADGIRSLKSGEPK